MKGPIMKKPILILLLFVTSLAFAKNVLRYDQIIWHIAFEDTEDALLSPNELFEKYRWDIEEGAKLSMQLYNDIQTNYNSLAKYEIYESNRRGILLGALDWLAFTKKDEETRQILFNSLINSPNDERYKAHLAGAILEFLPEDEISDFIKEIVKHDGKYGKITVISFLAMCQSVYMDNPSKRDEIASGLKDSVKERIAEGDFIFYEDDVYYYIDSMGDLYPERKSILQEAAEYYQGKPSFTNEYAVVMARIQEIESSEPKAEEKKADKRGLLVSAFVVALVFFVSFSFYYFRKKKRARRS